MILSLKQQRFAEEYIISGNATDAASKAGYSKKTAYSQGQRLLKNVEIKKYIDERLQTAQNGRIATADDILRYLTETMKLEDLPRKERTKAAELLGKRYKLFTENIDPNGKGDQIELRITVKDCKND